MRIVCVVFVVFFKCIYFSNAQNNFSLEKPDGKTLYEFHCQKCHLSDGKGLEKVYPPLAKSDFLHKNHKAVVKIIANGMTGEILVNGVRYNLTMPKPSPALNIEEITAIANFIFNNFENKPRTFTEKQVKKILGKDFKL